MMKRRIIYASPTHPDATPESSTFLARFQTLYGLAIEMGVRSNGNSYSLRPNIDGYSYNLKVL
ncbi:MAG: hypothetical protein PUP93_00915 [Rhizonema sp. NSF051]|nr:hypothetical protein [Rhizonema sp. NSF051]